MAEDTEAGAVPSPARTTAAVGADPLLRVDGLRKTYPVRSGRRRATLAAVDGVSFSLASGHTLGLVGESGSGKSTVGRTVLQLQRPTAGSVSFRGRELTTLSKRELRSVRREMQIVFQDPYASLDPRWTVERILLEPLRVNGQTRDRAGDQAVVEGLLESVGLDADARTRYAHEFSGGQRQRLGIARALALDPALMVLDEPVSALDVSVQAGILNLLRSLQQRLDVAFLFISHDLGVVRHVCGDVAVMYLGKIVEIGPTEVVFSRPRHPYTMALLSAVPEPGSARRERIVLRGDVPSAVDPPSGCRFRTRCVRATSVCADVEPPLTSSDGGHRFACHHPLG